MWKNDVSLVNDKDKFSLIRILQMSCLLRIKMQTIKDLYNHTII